MAAPTPGFEPGTAEYQSLVDGEPVVYPGPFLDEQALGDVPAAALPTTRGVLALTGRNHRSLAALGLMAILVGSTAMAATRRRNEDETSWHGRWGWGWGQD